MCESKDLGLKKQRLMTRLIEQFKYGYISKEVFISLIEPLNNARTGSQLAAAEIIIRENLGG